MDFKYSSNLTFLEKLRLARILHLLYILGDSMGYNCVEAMLRDTGL